MLASSVLVLQCASPGLLVFSLRYVCVYPGGVHWTVLTCRLIIFFHKFAILGDISLSVLPTYLSSLLGWHH